MADSKHIAIFMPSLDGGGAERMMVALASRFAQRGHAVDIVLAMARGPFLAEVPAAVRVVDLGCSRVLSSFRPLLRYLRRERPQAVLSTLNHANVISLAASCLAPAGIRFAVREANVIWSPPAPGEAKGRNIHSGNLRDAFLPPLMRVLYRRADAIIAVSDDVQDDLRTFIKGIGRKVVTIPNSVTPWDIVAKSHEPLHHPWFGPGRPPVILSIGRLTGQKDHATLIRAFHLLSRDTDARLLILGEGEERPNLERMVGELGLGEKVGLPGFADNPFAYLRHAAMFVLSSRFEGMPNVLLQAMACGAAVISTDCPGGTAAILEHGKWGELVGVGDVEALAAAMRKVLSRVSGPDTTLRAADFGIDRAADAYLQVLFGNEDGGDRRITG